METMNKTALITGASGGIGYELAKLLAHDGYNLILVARNSNNLGMVGKKLADKHKIEVICIAKDLTYIDAVDEVYDIVKEKGKQVDILVNNAGFGDRCDFIHADWARPKNMIDLNITALMRLTYLVGQDMAKQKSGKILNISSVACVSPGPYMAVYYASKAFVTSFSQAMSEELSKYGITVTAMCPGPTATNFEKEAHMGSSRMFKTLYVASAEDVAKKAYRTLMKGKTLTFHGLTSKLMNISSHFAPRFISRKVAKKVNGTPE